MEIELLGLTKTHMVNLIPILIPKILCLEKEAMTLTRPHPNPNPTSGGGDMKMKQKNDLAY